MKFILSLGFAVIALAVSGTAVSAQTFGPICDGVTVTCPPSPIPTDTPAPSETPPPELPRSGSSEMLLMIVGISTILVSGGFLMRTSSAPESR